jgi:nitrous oxide reductase
MENNVKQEQQNTGTDRRGFLKAAAQAGAGAAWTLGGGLAASVALARASATGSSSPRGP